MAAVSRASSRRHSATPCACKPAMPASLRSLAITVAPSRAKAMAVARPMPAADAVQKASLPLRRSAIVPPWKVGLTACRADPAAGAWWAERWARVKPLCRHLRGRAQRGAGGAVRQEMGREVDAAAAADRMMMTRQPLLGLAAAGGAQVQQQFEIGFDLAFRR